MLNVNVFMPVGCRRVNVWIEILVSGTPQVCLDQSDAGDAFGCRDDTSGQYPDPDHGERECRQEQISERHIDHAGVDPPPHSEAARRHQDNRQRRLDQTREHAHRRGYRRPTWPPYCGKAVLDADQGSHQAVTGEARPA